MNHNAIIALIFLARVTITIIVVAIMSTIIPLQTPTHKKIAINNANNQDNLVKNVKHANL